MFFFAPNDLDDAMCWHARHRWADKALAEARARLYCAGEARGHLQACRQTADAADALLVAGILAKPKPGRRLRRLAKQLHDALATAIGHPSAALLEGVDRDAAELQDRLREDRDAI